LNNLEIFLKEVVGNDYNFSVKQLIKRKTQRNISSDDSEEVRLVQEGRAFFCSELVAKCWKVCGIMKSTDQACSNFLPSSFSEEKQTVEVDSGIEFQGEQMIFAIEEPKQSPKLGRAKQFPSDENEKGPGEWQQIM
jgi:hypothetical protein